MTTSNIDLKLAQRRLDEVKRNEGYNPWNLVDDNEALIAAVKVLRKTNSAFHESNVILRKDREYARGEIEALREWVGVLTKEPTTQEIQCACLAYGGRSFSGPMKEALECFLRARA